MSVLTRTTIFCDLCNTSIQFQGHWMRNKARKQAKVSRGWETVTTSKGREDLCEMCKSKKTAYRIVAKD